MSKDIINPFKKKAYKNEIIFVRELIFTIHRELKTKHQESKQSNWRK